MPAILYSPQFQAGITMAAYDLKNFFDHVHILSSSLSQYRRYVRHQYDFDRFQNDLDAIEAGHKSLSSLTIGSILTNEKAYVLHHGPWRGYLFKKADGEIEARLFKDCR